MKYLSVSLLLLSVATPRLALAEPPPELVPVEVQPCAPSVGILPPAPPATRVRSPALIGGGVGLIFGGLATIAGGVGVSFAGSSVAASECRACATSTGPYPGIQALGVAIAVVGLGGMVGGVAMIASGAKSVPEDEAPRSRRSTIEPFFRPGIGNAALGFNF